MASEVRFPTRGVSQYISFPQFEAQKLVLLEAGCGVGNFIFPLLEEDLNIFVYACDFSTRAVEFVKVRRCTTDDQEPVGLLIKQHRYMVSFSFCPQEHSLYCTERCSAFQCDLTKDDLRGNVPVGSVDVATLIFVLSAIHPDKMQQALDNIYRVRQG